MVAGEDSFRNRHFRLLETVTFTDAEMSVWTLFLLLLDQQ